MTLIEIAMMKAFTKDRGMDEMFISLYTKYKLRENPISIEDYLRKADASNVFVSAFYWVTNSRFGYDYWQDFQRKWDRYRAEKKSEYPMDDIRNFKGKGKVLRHNWDASHFWKTENRIETARRYGVTLDAEQALLIAKEHERQAEHFAIIASEGKKIEEKGASNDLLSEFELIDLSNSRRLGNRRLKDDEISYNVNNGGYRVTFNKTLTEKFKKRGGYEYVAVGKNKNGDVMLLLNDNNGVTINDANGNDNANISSKAMCEKLASLLGISEKYLILKVKEIAATNDYVAYLVSK